MTEEAVAVEVRAPEPAVMAECKAALSDVYAPTLQRMHKVLDELRTSQDKLLDILDETEDKLLWRTQLDNVMEKLYALPAYADKAVKVGIEMKALRLRMDRAKQRAMALQKKRDEGES